VTFEDSIAINAPVPRVWDFLLDVDRSAACMPGVEQVTLIDDRTFDGIITASVGPISGTFSFRARIVESNPPRQLTAQVEGTDSVTRSTLKMDVTMTLDSAGADATDLAYRAVVDVHGRLAILGDMLLRATASLILEEFTKRLRLQLEGNGTQT
jgi:carbon monoxide dehydrogenase subunit G